jgi:hypothetical protein
MKTQEVTGSQGVIIHVVDTDDPVQLNVATNTFTQTQEWTKVSKVFEVSANTRRARVEILRPYHQDGDVPLRGMVWIDAIELTAAP